MRRSSLLAAICTLSVLGFLAVSPDAPVTAAPLHRLAGLHASARLLPDRNGVTDIEASSARDLFFLQGWVHARDRLFQMDVTRRQASGTLAELLGKAALPSDVQTRTIGLRRAAERTWAVTPPDLRAALTAYTDGVNAYVAAHPLPIAYGALHITSFEPWTPVDSLTIGKAISFELSFDLDIGPTLQLEAYVAALGPQRGYALFTQDVMRAQPFSNAATVPDASGGHAATPALAPRLTPADLARLPEAARLARGYLGKISGNPMFTQALGRDGTQGSNEWAVSGTHTTDGHPLIANDPHLSLGAPSTFYPIGLAGTRHGRRGRGLRGHARRHHRAQQVDLLGRDHQPDGRDRHLPGEGRRRPVLAQRPIHRRTRARWSTSWRFPRRSGTTWAASLSRPRPPTGCHRPR